MEDMFGRMGTEVKGFCKIASRVSCKECHAPKLRVLTQPGSILACSHKTALIIGVLDLKPKISISRNLKCSHKKQNASQKKTLVAGNCVSRTCFPLMFPNCYCWTLESDTSPSEFHSLFTSKQTLCRYAKMQNTLSSVQLLFPVTRRFIVILGCGCISLIVLASVLIQLHIQGVCVCAV